MKTWITAAALTVGLATSAFADPILGTWQTGKDDNGKYGHITIAKCGSAICGTLSKSFNSDGSTYSSGNNGKKIIWDMQADGGGKYSGGKVWAPDRDKTYKSKLKLSGNKLAVSGCVLGICRDGGTWTRIN